VAISSHQLLTLTTVVPRADSLTMGERTLHGLSLNHIPTHSGVNIVDVRELGLSLRVVEAVHSAERVKVILSNSSLSLPHPGG